MRRNAKKTSKASVKKNRARAKIVLAIILCLVLWYVRLQEENFNQEQPNVTPTLEPTATISTESTKSDNKFTSYTGAKLEVYFFDVGQADSILLLTEGKSMLVDTGNRSDAREDTKLVKDNINLTYELKKLGIEKIDILVATHPHEDHMGSMYKIISAFEIGELYANTPKEEFSSNQYYERFIEAIEEKTVHLISPTMFSELELKEKINAYNLENEEKITYREEDYIRVGDTIPFANAKVTLLAPNANEYSNTNDYSLVFMVEFEGVKLLLTGDATTFSEEEMLKFVNGSDFDLDCDILKVSHHGSRTSSGEDFISAVSPEYAIVMVGEDNSYGLPDEDVIERLKKHGAIIYQTNEVGDIKLTIDDGLYEFDLDYSHEVKE